MKRWRSKKAKPGQLIAYYGMADGEGPDVCFAWGDGCSRRDGSLLHYIFGTKLPRLAFGEERQNGPVVFDQSFLDDLKARGYDITTLKFSIEKRKEG